VRLRPSLEQKGLTDERRRREETRGVDCVALMVNKVVATRIEANTTRIKTNERRDRVTKTKRKRKKRTKAAGFYIAMMHQSG
jgi:hypothetical protein